MAPRSPISASVADWLSSVRGFLGFTAAHPAGSDAQIRSSSALYAPLAGTLVRIQARYGSLNARIRRDTDRLALWMLAKIDLPEVIADMLVDGLSPEGQIARASGAVPAFRGSQAGSGSGLSELVDQGSLLVFEDEEADERAFASRVAPRGPLTTARKMRRKS